jgi:hypothetical protein
MEDKKKDTYKNVESSSGEECEIEGPPPLLFLAFKVGPAKIFLENFK